MGPVAINWPPYLNLPLAFALAAELVVWVVGSTWRSRPGQVGQA